MSVILSSNLRFNFYKQLKNIVTIYDLNLNLFKIRIQKKKIKKKFNCNVITLEE